VLLPPKFAQFFSWGYSDCGIRLFRDRETLSVFEFLHEDQITKASVSETGQLLFTAGQDNAINVYSIVNTGDTSCVDRKYDVQ